MAKRNQLRKWGDKCDIKPWKKWLSLFLVLSLLFIGYWFFVERGDIESRVQDGDIIFQTSHSTQSKVIQSVTQSHYSHMGMIYRYKGNVYVYEANQSVKSTPLNEWISDGEKGHFVVKRLRNVNIVLTPDTKFKMFQMAIGFLGRKEDLAFSWDDQTLYCSEVIWKIYQRGAGIEIGKLQQLGEFDLTDPMVSQKMKAYYGDQIPMNEIVITPQAIYESDQLKTVIRNDRFLFFKD